MEVKELTENNYYVTAENFKVGLGKEESPKTQLGILFEIFDPADASMDKADYDYEVSVLASIIIHAEDPLDIIDSDNYRGGVGCNDIFLENDIKKYVTSLKPVESFEHEETEIPPIIFDDSMHGTFLPLMTKDEDILVPFLKKVSEVAMPMLSMMIGFRLDQDVNLIGNTGWDMLEMQKSGKDLITERIQNLGK